MAGGRKSAYDYWQATPTPLPSNPDPTPNLTLPLILPDP